MNFRLSREPIDDSPAEASAMDGATATFVGRVRNHNEGRQVSALEYEAYGELALTEGEKIVAEALERFAITSAHCAHRVGLLQIGDTAIRVDVASPHRKAAFQACRYVVDEAKRRLPIWKKEHYAGGTSEWVNCAEGPVATAYYSRQTRLPEVGEQGQAQLSAAKVLVVGAGGLGCSALQYLVAAGVGTVGICEHDQLEESNLHRQSLYAHGEIGQQKAVLAAERMRALNPFVTVVAHDAAVTPASVEALVSAYDFVLDCTDNFETKFLLNDACLAAGKTLIQASIHQYEGQLLVIRPGGPCLRCLWPETPEEGCVGSCAEVGVLGFVPGLFGTLQAAEAIKLILGMRSPIAEGSMLLLNLLDYSVQVLSMPKMVGCPGCGGGAVSRQDWIVSPEELNGSVVVDIRDLEEVEESPLPIPCVHILSGALGTQDWETGKEYVLVCSRGARSSAAVKALRGAGVSNVFSLAGGLEGFRRSWL
jgi:sulfur-carrier protein adenylyltransferase/sulfurtransferase